MLQLVRMRELDAHASVHVTMCRATLGASKNAVAVELPRIPRFQLTDQGGERDTRGSSFGIRSAQNAEGTGGGSRAAAAGQAARASRKSR